MPLEMESPAGPLDSAFMLAWIDALIQETCRVAPVLVGQIVGGAIAARYAGRHSGRLRKLVLVDSLGLAPFRPSPDFGAALTSFLSEPTEDSHDRLWHYCAHEIEFLRCFTLAIQSVHPRFSRLPVDPPPLPLQLQAPDRVRKELSIAGLQNVEVET